MMKTVLNIGVEFQKSNRLMLIIQTRLVILIMNTEELRQAILTIIGDLYKKCYIGPLKIVPLSTIGWDV